MVHLQMILVTLLIINNAQLEETPELGNLDLADIFSTNESKFANLVDLNKVETTKPPVKLVLIYASINLKTYRYFRRNALVFQGMNVLLIRTDMD